MIFGLLGLASATGLTIYQSYEIPNIILRAKSTNQVYLLVLFKPPSDVNLTSAAFSRFIGSIPLPMNPILGITIDPTASFNQVIYSDGSGNQVTSRFPYRQVMRDYVGSLMRGVSAEVRTRLKAILDNVHEVPPKEDTDGLSEREKSLEYWKTEYLNRNVKKNMTGAVEELLSLKHSERARLVKSALAFQKSLDELLPPSDGRALPAFESVDPRNEKSEPDLPDAPDLGIDEDDDLPDPKVAAEFDEDAADNDALVDDEKPSKSDLKFNPDSDTDTTGEQTAQDAEEDRKRAGPIQNALDAVRDKWNSLVGGEKKETVAEEDGAPKQKRTVEDVERDNKARDDADDNRPRQRERVEGPVAKKKDDEEEDEDENPHKKLAENANRKDKADPDANPNPVAPRWPAPVPRPIAPPPEPALAAVAEPVAPVAPPPPAATAYVPTPEPAVVAAGPPQPAVAAPPTPVALAVPEPAVAPVPAVPAAVSDVKPAEAPVGPRPEPGVASTGQAAGSAWTQGGAVPAGERAEQLARAQREANGAAAPAGEGTGAGQAVSPNQGSEAAGRSFVRRPAFAGEGGAGQGQAGVAGNSGSDGNTVRRPAVLPAAEPAPVLR
jgi:hypothetical protein